MRGLIALGTAALCVACAPATAETGFVDDFDGPDMQLAAEGQVTGPWVVTSGTLDRKDGDGWTDSPVFRMDSLDRNFGNVKVAARVDVEDMTDRGTDYDGLHFWVGYQSEYALYAVSVDRRDGNMIIKKKCAGGPDPSNGGTYYDLTPPLGPAPIPFGDWQQVTVELQDLDNGAVKITATRDRFAMEATDDGVGCAPFHGGGVGVRGDNATIRMSQVTVRDN